MPCCWAPTARAPDAGQVGGGRCGAEGVPPDLGVDLGAVRMSGAALADDSAGGGVDDEHLAGLGGGVDAGDKAALAPLLGFTGARYPLRAPAPHGYRTRARRRVFPGHAPDR